MRALSAKAASRAPHDNIPALRFFARRNQHGFKAGDVTAEIASFPVEKVRRFIRHGILTCEPASNFLLWGKDVAAWLLENHREHPATMAELVAAQKAMAAGDVAALPVSAAWVAQEKLRVEAEAKQAAEDKAAQAGVKARTEEAMAQAAERAKIAAAQVAALKASSLPQDAGEEDGAGEDAHYAPEASNGDPDAPIDALSKPRKGRKAK